MISFDIEKITPKFLLQDKNGVALAKAIEVALKHMCAVVRDGSNNVANVDKMPEWRLDEMAWETNCLYDHSATIEEKRRWIGNAIPYYKEYGTKAAIINFLSSYFDEIEVEEWENYNAQPFHFRVTTTGKWTNANEAWARKAIAISKNVRSVLDSISPGSNSNISIISSTDVIAKFPYVFAGNHVSGTVPLHVLLGRIADNVANTEGTADHTVFPYTLSGTKPHTNIIGAIRSDEYEISHESQKVKYPYLPSSTNAHAGTSPHDVLIGRSTDENYSAKGDVTNKVYPYTLSGTNPNINTITKASDETYGVSLASQSTNYPYLSPGDNVSVGTEPLTSTVTKDSIRASPDGVAAVITYTMCGECDN